MAEPLTSSDILRERMGFGISPLASVETRKAYAEAGLSPLGTQERERFERGGGISPMASTSEKEAWKMAEYMAGQREQAPTEYGGLGERPTGTSRRAIRMQEQWDKQQENQIQAYKLQRDAYEKERAFANQEKALAIDQARLDLQAGTAEAERKLKDQVDLEASAFVKGINQLDPRGANYRESVAKLAGEYPLGALDPRATRIIEMYEKTNDIYLNNQIKLQERNIKAEKGMQDVAKVAEQSGLPMSNFVTTDPVTGRDVVNYEALGRAQGALAKKDTKKDEPRYGGKTVNEINSIISNIDADIEEANVAGKVGEIDGLKAKQKYYKGLLPKENNGVANTTETQYIPPPPIKDREVGKTYPSPKGEMKWTGTGWVEP